MTKGDCMRIISGKYKGKILKHLKAIYIYIINSDFYREMYLNHNDYEFNH